MVDQGEFDPALKGYFLPEGFKLEIVINEPDTINPVGMTFAPDGTLFVMEWRPDPVTGDKWFEVKETFRYKDGTTRQVATMKKFTTDLVKQFRYNASDRKVRPAEDHHRRGIAVDASCTTTAGSTSPAAAPCGGGGRACRSASAGPAPSGRRTRTIRGAFAKRSPRASAASTITRCPA